MALSKQSPTEPIDGWTPISRHRPPNAIEVYMALIILAGFYDVLTAEVSVITVRAPIDEEYNSMICNLNCVELLILIWHVGRR